MNLDSFVKLNNGVRMPILGLGVWNASGPETAQAVKWALGVGYRHFDTAAIYGNEKEVGQAIRGARIPREEIFVTTKLWRDDHDEPERAFQNSFDALDISYIDLFLSHFPATGKRIKAYKAMEKILASGKCRAIGVSNYTVAHLEQLLKETSIVPAVNQVEYHVFLAQKELKAFCDQHDIKIEAYSPLARGQGFDRPGLQAMAQKYKKSPAQIMIRWCLEQGLITIPKSVRREKIVENATVFDFSLSAEDMAELAKLNENLRVCWDPSSVP